MAGGDYLYLHADYASKDQETGRILDNDPEYYPFSYVFGKKVAIGTQMENASQTNITAALQDTNGAYRNWSKAEMENFVGHMSQSKLSDELKNAGISGFASPLTMNVYWDSAWLRGEYMGGDSAKIENTGKQNSISNDYSPFNKTSFTYLKLYDYTPNAKAYTDDQLKPKELDGVYYTKLSPNKTSPRNHTVDTIFIDVLREPLSVEACANKFASTRDQKSANYGIDTNGRLGLFVQEKDRAWYSGSAANDHRSIVIVISSESSSPYKISDAAYETLIALLTEICERNEFDELVWSTDSNERVNHLNGANITVARDFRSNNDGPGDYLYEKMGEIVKRVNRDRLYYY